MLALIGIIAGLGLLMYLAFKSWSIVWIAPLCACVVIFTGGLNLLDTLTGPFMDGLVGYVKSWFPVFMLSAIFGCMMDYTGAANAVAVWLVKLFGPKSAVAAVVIVCGILTYGGVSLFVVVFAMYPLSLALFREADLPRRVIPGALALGAFEFTMTAIPGSPQIQNLIPMKYFGTTPMAAPVLGLIAAAISIFGGIGYLMWRCNYLKKKGERFEDDVHAKSGNLDPANLPNPIISLIPMVMVVITLNVLCPQLLGIPSSDNKAVLVALFVGTVLVAIFNYKRRDVFINAIGDGVEGSVGAIMNTASAVGFGSVVKASPGFATLSEMVLGIGGGNPLISIVVALNILAGATGSASGGMTIALEALGEKYMAMAAETGISPEAMHRISSISAGGLDSLPHNGAVLTLLQNCHLNHKEAYFDVFITSIVLPLVMLVVLIVLGTMGVV